MNKAFKAIWSDVRQSFVTTSEIQSSHGKRSKASVSLSVATVLLATSGLVSTAYVETRSEEHTSELQSLRLISYAVFCLKKKN